MKCDERFNKAKAVHSIMRHFTEKTNFPLEELHTAIGWPLLYIENTVTHTMLSRSPVQFNQMACSLRHCPFIFFSAIVRAEVHLERGDACTGTYGSLRFLCGQRNTRVPVPVSDTKFYPLILRVTILTSKDMASTAVLNQKAHCSFNTIHPV